MQQALPIKRRRSASEIRELVVRFHQSGLSRAAFVRNEDLCLATLSSYLKRESTAPARTIRSGPPAFFELEPGTLRSLAGSQLAMYRLCLNGGLALEVPPGFSREEVEVLLSVLAEARLQ
jgi:hypothetical protein